EPTEVIYEEKDRSLHRLRILRSDKSVLVRARILASFIGSTEDIPVLYDARSMCADWPVGVPSKEPVDVKKAMEVLEKSRMGLKKDSLEPGRPFYSWKGGVSPAVLKRAPGKPDPSKEKQDRAPALLIPFDPAQKSNGQKVYMSKGAIPLLSFLTLVSEEKQLPVYTTEKTSSMRGVELLVINDV